MEARESTLVQSFMVCLRFYEHDGVLRWHIDGGWHHFRNMDYLHMTTMFRL